MRRAVKNSLRTLRATPGKLSQMAAAHVGPFLGRPPRFMGLYPSREAALSRLPQSDRKGYDDENVAEVSLEAMTTLRMPSFIAASITA